jgi:hypothetical protein
MAILRVKDAEGNIYDIPAIKGEKGDKGEDGTMVFEDLTPEQKESLRGYTPQRGVDYWTPADKEQMVRDVLNALPNASGVSF